MRKLRRRSTAEVARDLVTGALAGAVGTALMQPAARLVPHLPSPELSPAEQQRQSRESSEPATEKMAERLVAPLGIELDEEARHSLGNAVHWSYGVGWGAIYGALVGRRGTALLSGVLLGFGLWLIGDELLVPALKLSKNPGLYPTEVHAKALASHLAFGTATDGVFRILRAWS